LLLSLHCVCILSCSWLHCYITFAFHGFKTSFFHGHFFLVLWLLLLCPSCAWLHHTYSLHKTIVHCANILFWWLSCHFILPTFCCGDIVPTFCYSKIFFPSFQVLFLFFALSSCVIQIFFPRCNYSCFFKCFIYACSGKDDINKCNTHYYKKDGRWTRWVYVIN